MIGGDKKGLFYHLIAEVFSVQALVVINLIASPTIPWCLWALGSMAVAVLVHIVAYNMFLKGRGTEGRKKSWMDTKIDEELEKARRLK